MNAKEFIEILASQDRQLDQLAVTVSVVLELGPDDMPNDLIHHPVVSVTLCEEEEVNELTLICTHDKDHDNVAPITLAELRSLMGGLDDSVHGMRVFVGTNLLPDDLVCVRSDTPLVGCGIDDEEGTFMLLIEPPPEGFIDKLMEYLLAPEEDTEEGDGEGAAEK